MMKKSIAQVFIPLGLCWGLLFHAGTVRAAEDPFPSWNDTFYRVAGLYQGGQFAELEAVLAEASRSQKIFTGGESPAAAAYWAFRRLIPAPGDVGPHEALARQWRTAMPDSAFVIFLEARIAYARAWNLRGTGFAGSVSDESWELYRLRLGEAEKILLTAPAKVMDSPLSHNLLLAITQDNPKSATHPDAVLAKAAKRWPRYFEFYEVRLTRLVPKWGGSWQAVETFIDVWSRHLAATEGDTLYARLYISLLSQGVTPNETAMDWPRMRASLAELTQRYPTPEFRNLRASYACAARDKQAFVDALSTLPDAEIKPDNWIQGHSHEGCMRWARV